jgi:hypothetical protein
MIAQLGGHPSTNMITVWLFLFVSLINALISALLKKESFLKVSTKKIFIFCMIFITSFSFLFFNLNQSMVDDTILDFAYIAKEAAQGNYYKITPQAPNQILLIAWTVFMVDSTGNYSMVIQNVCFMVAGCLLLFSTSFHVLARNESRIAMKRAMLITLTSLPAVLFFVDVRYFNSVSFLLLSVIIYAIITKKPVLSGAVLGVSLFFSLDFVFILIGLVYALRRMRDPSSGQLLLSVFVLTSSLSMFWLYQSTWYYLLGTLFLFFPSRAIYRQEMPMTTILEAIYPGYAYFPWYVLFLPLVAIILALSMKKRRFSRAFREKGLILLLPVMRIVPLIFQVEYPSSSMLPLMLLLCLNFSSKQKKDFTSLVVFVNMLVLMEYLVSYMVPQWFVYYILIEDGILIVAFSYYSFPDSKNVFPDNARALPYPVQG